MGTAAILANKLDGALFGLKNGTKTTSDVLPLMKRLKDTGELIYEDYVRKYEKILSERKAKATA